MKLFTELPEGDSELLYRMGFVIATGVLQGWGSASPSSTAGMLVGGGAVGR